MSRIVVGGLVFWLRFPVGAWILGRMQLGIVNIAYFFSRYTQEILNLYFPEFRLEIWFIFQILLIDLFLKSFWWRVENFIDSSIYIYIYWNYYPKRIWYIISKFFLYPLIGILLIPFQLFPWTPKFPGL